MKERRKKSIPNNAHMDGYRYNTYTHTYTCAGLDVNIITNRLIFSYSFYMCSSLTICVTK